jgi:hypothetical protein
MLVGGKGFGWWEGGLVQERGFRVEVEVGVGV